MNHKIAQVYDADDLYGYNVSNDEPQKPNRFEDSYLDDENDLRVEMNFEPENQFEEDFLSEETEIDGSLSVSSDGEEKISKEFSFTLPAVPGASEEIDDTEMEVENEEEEDVEVEDDPWKWTLSNFPEWLQSRLQNLPKHSGKDTAGIERVISVLEALNREISKAFRMDLNGVLDVGMIEEARDEIQKGLDRCNERLEKLNTYKYKKTKGKKKKADDDSGDLVKTAGTPAIQVQVPLLISGLARICINGLVSAGHDIEETFFKLAESYELDKKQKFELITLLGDMGYYVRRDRGVVPGEEDKFDLGSSDNMDWGAQYYA